MRYKHYSPEYFLSNRERLITKLKENELLVLFGNDQVPRNNDVFHPWRQSSNFFYLTGIDQPESKLIIDPFSKTQSTVLFIPHQDPQKEQWEGKMLSKEDAKRISGVDKVLYLDEFDNFFFRIQRAKEVLLTDVNEVFPNQPLNSYQLFLKQIRDRIPGLNFKKLGPIINSLRVIKSDEELAFIRKCIQFTNEALKDVMLHLKPGIMEYEVEAILAYNYIKNGCSRLGFDTIVAGGKNATTLHYTENDQILKDGELLLIDNGGEYGMFTSDITRVFPINGRFNSRQKKCYETVLRIQKEILNKLEIGAPFSDIHKIADKVYGEILKKEGFIQKEESHKKITLHSVTHFLGLDVHDVGDTSLQLQPGMVFTMEPGLYLPDEGIGIRIEDDILCTKDGFEVLSKDIPKEINEIEELCNSVN